MFPNELIWFMRSADPTCIADGICDQSWFDLSSKIYKHRATQQKKTPKFAPANPESKKVDANFPKSRFGEDENWWLWEATFLRE